MTNPVGRPPGSGNEQEVRAESLRREAEANRRAQASHRQGEIARIKELHRGGQGMSRARLVTIYGRDAVDLALGHRQV